MHAVLSLWRSSRSRHASTPDVREDIERLVEGSPAALLVAESGGQVVGAVIAGWDGWGYPQDGDIGRRVRNI